MNEKPLCKLAEEKNIDELKKLAYKANYICPCCFRVSNDPKRICCKPEKIKKDSTVKKLISKFEEKLKIENFCNKNNNCCE